MNIMQTSRNATVMKMRMKMKTQMKTADLTVIIR